MELNPFSLSLSGESYETSLTLKYLLDNPTLLQPPGQQDEEKCKEKGECKEQEQQNELISAYLGPQIWDDILLSDDLKLEPVDLDELLENSGVDDGMSDLKMLMTTSPASLDGSFQTEQKEGEPQPSFIPNYDDMPQLDTEDVPQPTFHYSDPKTPPNKNIYPPNGFQNGGKDQGAFTPPQYSSPPSNGYNYPPTTPPGTPPIVVNIPSPVDINYQINSTDVLLSTPNEGDLEIDSFNPCTRKFTEDELKPQPIVRKSKKNYVAVDDKDGKYWKRRNKNNEAAKKSREARRIKENQIAMRANFLEQENIGLKLEVQNLRQELNRVVELVRTYEQRFSSQKNK